MSTSPNPVSTQWPAIKSDIKKSWSKILDSDLEKTNGDMKEIFERTESKKASAAAVVEPVKTTLKL
jgi:hypothetical protein